MPAVLASLYSFPESFFESLKPVGVAQPAAAPADTAQRPLATRAAGSAAEPQPAQAGADGAADAAPVACGCVACGLDANAGAFSSQAEQREHFKSDWHRINVKRRHGGRPPLSEAQFEQLISRDEDVSSISGSSSDEDEEQSSSQQDGGRVPGSLPQQQFVAADGRRIAVWRSLLAPASADAIPSAEAQKALLQLRRQLPRWAVVVSSGGHFAAAIFAMAPPPTGKQQPKAELPLFEVAAHKTFHRYVVRAKAGGRQATQDATGKFAKSAGSQIRRHNEAMLTADIKGTLKEHTAQLGPNDLIFVQASGANAAAIFGGDNPPLSRSDARIRRIPFPTRRPTFAETKRVVRILASVYAAEPPAAAQPLAAAPAADASSQALRPPSQTIQPSVAAQQQDHDQEAAEAIQLPRLHRAAMAGDADKVQYLLDSGQDPTQCDARGRPPYLLATHKAVRDAFRRYMAAHPEQWDYSRAAIPSALTDEMEQHQEARAAEKKAKQRAREKERKKAQAVRKAKQAEEAKAAAEQEVDAAAAAAASAASRVANVRGGARAMTPAERTAAAAAAAQQRSVEEAAARRERAAAAAEARMKALQLSAQQQQLHH